MVDVTTTVQRVIVKIQTAAKTVATLISAHNTDNGTHADIRSAIDLKADDADLSSHESDTDNPHEVTATQVGLGNCDNTADLDKPVSNAAAYLFGTKANLSNFNTHVADANNPHSVTATQLGLGNCDNTSDADKPISDLAQAALDLKANTASLATVATSGLASDLTLDATHRLVTDTEKSTWNGKQDALGYTAADDSLAVHLAGTETITGAKTFSAVPTIAPSSFTNAFVIKDSAGSATFQVKNPTASYYSTYVGLNAGNTSSTALYCSSFGYGTLASNIAGNNNSAFGHNSLTVNTGSSNSAFGKSSFGSNTSGAGGAAFGYFAGAANTTGASLTAIGSNAASSNTIGAYNTALGGSALASNTIKGNCTAIGFQSLYYSAGIANTALGTNSARQTSTGTYITALGYNSLYGNKTGDYNTAIGALSGRYITGGATANETSSNSVYLGYNTKANADGDTNEIVIGYDATGAGSNTATLGNASITDTHLRGNVNIPTLKHTGSSLGFYNTTPISKPAVTGSRGGNLALASLLTQLANLGLITNSSAV